MRFAAALLASLLASGVAAAAAPAPPPPGPELWRGALAGMNIDEVVAAVPSAVPFTGQTMDNGALAGLAAPAELDGSPADAVFFFRGRLLAAVLVESRRLPARPDYLAKAAALEAQMTSVYGQPLRCVKRPEIAADNCEWRYGALKVAVSYRDVGGGAPLLQVLYAPVR